MPTVLDEFVLEVGLDPAKFEQAGRELDSEFERAKTRLEDFGKHVERTGTRISEIFGLTKTGVVGLLAGFIGAEGAAFVDRVATMDARTMQLAHSIGTSTRELSLWQNMVRTVGGDAADAATTLAGLNDAFMNMRMGNAMPSAPFASLLSRAGIDFRRSTPGGALEGIMGFLQGQPEQAQRFWLQQVPGMNESMMFLLMEIMRHPEKMRNLREEIEKLGLASEKSGSEALELAEKTGELRTAWENFARVLFPSLSAALNMMTALFSSKFAGLIASVFGGAVAGGAAGSVIPGVGTGIGAVAGAVAGGLTYEGVFGGAGASTGGAAAPTGGAAAMIESRGDRNNNPGNIEAGPFATAHGATGSDGRFAIFPTFETGAAAMAQLLHDRYSGLTLAQIQQRWVGNPDAGYLSQMMASTGLKAGDVPNLNDNAVVAALIRGMMKGEGTHHVTRGDKPAAVNRSSAVTVGSINVASAKADPAAVADQIPDAIKRYSMLAGINEGLT